MKNSALHKPILIALAIILLSVSAPAILFADEVIRGIGGTGHSDNASGLGGTGNSMSGIAGTGHDSGIGGTGLSASTQTGIGGTGHTSNDGGIGGTGIVGIVTGFGSIWVNGLEVQYDTQTQVASNTAPANSHDLAIGQVVAIEAQDVNHALQAHKISMIHAVSGEVSAVTSNNMQLTVLGQTVNLTPHTLTLDATQAQNISVVKPGDFIKVSGLRLPSGEIVASRIERTAPLTESNLVATITAISENVIHVPGLTIQTTGNNSLSVGQEISVVGTVHAGVLTARSITPSPSTQVYEKTAHINLQGYVGAGAVAGQIKVGNLDVVVGNSALAAASFSPGELVQISGRFSSDHRLIADRIEFSRDQPERISRDNAENHEHGGDRLEHTEHLDRPDRNDRIDRPEKSERSERTTPQSSEHAH